MNIQKVSCEDQYERDIKLDRSVVLKLQQWQQTQPHLPNITESEAIHFVHAREYDLEKAKKCMDSYYTVRTMCEELFSSRNVFGADIQSHMKILAMILLPGLSKEGYRIIYCSFIDTDPSKFNFCHLIKLVNMMADLFLELAGICEGYSIIVDISGLKFSHLTRVKLFTLGKFLHYVQEALPIRLRAIHFINATSIMRKIMSMMKPFMKKELMNIIHIHKSLDTFLDVYVAKAVMPEEYGGSAGKKCDMIAEIYDVLESNREFFIEEEASKRVKETLRPGKPKTERDVFGYFYSLVSGKKNNASNGQ